MSDITLTIQEATPVNLTIAEQTPVNLSIGGGASAYQIWLDAGNTGTEQDFLDSLIGADGATGATGPAGPQGATGATGPQGPAGSDAPVQTLSIDGNDLTLSDGGGTVTLPGGASDALGTGFTSGGGSGTIPGGTTITVDYDGDFIMDLSGPAIEGYNVLIGNPSGNIGFLFGGNNAKMIAGDAFVNVLSDDGMGEFSLQAAAGSIAVTSVYSQVSISESSTGFSIVDQRATPIGLEYSADYSATLKTNNRSVPDVGTVNLLKQTPASYTSAAAPNNTIFYSTTVNKLCYKDPGGTVNPLY